MKGKKYIKYIVEMIEKLVNIPSPSGYCAQVLTFLENEAKSMGYETFYLNKGGLIVTVHGKSEESDRHVRPCGYIGEQWCAQSLLTVS